MENINCKTTEYKVIIEDNRQDESIEHLFSEETNELAYLGPFDVCPKDIAGIAKDFSGKPVK